MWSQGVWWDMNMCALELVGETAWMAAARTGAASACVAGARYGAGGTV